MRPNGPQGGIRHLHLRVFVRPHADLQSPARGREWWENDWRVRGFGQLRGNGGDTFLDEMMRRDSAGAFFEDEDNQGKPRSQGHNENPHVQGGFYKPA